MILVLSYFCYLNHSCAEDITFRFLSGKTIFVLS